MKNILTIRFSIKDSRSIWFTTQHLHFLCAILWFGSAILKLFREKIVSYQSPSFCDANFVVHIWIHSIPLYTIKRKSRVIILFNKNKIIKYSFLNWPLIFIFGYIFYRQFNSNNSIFTTEEIIITKKESNYFYLFF